MGLFTSYLVTIGYLFLLPGADTGLALSLFSLAYLAPFTAHSVRLLIPRHIVRALLRKIGTADFGKDKAPLDKLQPIVDLIVKAVKDDQHETAREGLRLLTGRFVDLFRQTSGTMEVYFVTKPLVDLLERVARFCAQGRDFEMLEVVLVQFKELTTNLRQVARGPAVDHLAAAVDRTDLTAHEWFDQGKSEVEVAGVEGALADVRVLLARIKS